MTSHFNVGRSLRKLQAERRVTNRALAQAIGVNPVQVSRWRSNDDMRAQRLAQLADHFEMSIDDFLKVGE